MKAQRNKMKKLKRMSNLRRLIKIFKLLLVFKLIRFKRMRDCSKRSLNYFQIQSKLKLSSRTRADSLK